MSNFKFEELKKADLQVDAIYEGGRKGNAGDDPLSKLLNVSNQGGFRYRGTVESLQMVVLTSNYTEPDWPDFLDKESGMFTYYGDNRKPGKPLHDTPRNGNIILRSMFNAIHTEPEKRITIPPIFVFASTGNFRDVRFEGIAVPGSVDLKTSDDLVAIWKIAKGLRFQNYRAIFTILDISSISRAWITDIISGVYNTNNAPQLWQEWIDTGKYIPLRAVRTIEHRTKEEQIPQSDEHRKMISTIVEYFHSNPTSFETCAAAIIKLMDPNVASIDLTRPYRDGGRDGIGLYKIGTKISGINVDFTMEAKCYSITNSVGVKETSRLISRMKYRQFGIIITTSYLNNQAYKEIKEDGHPVIVISAKDITDILIDANISSAEQVSKWLVQNFPI